MNNDFEDQPRRAPALWKQVVVWAVIVGLVVTTGAAMLGGLF